MVNRKIFILLLAGVASVLVTGCQPDVVANAAVANQAEVVAVADELPPATNTLTVPEPAATATHLPAPPTMAAIPATPTTIPTAMPAFAAVDPTALAENGKQTANSTVLSTSVSPTHTPAPTVTPSATPIPTFTPPALPFTSDEDHYWLQRPIPEDGVVWTDKIYPYGSSKGGTLRTHHGVEFNVEKGSQVIAAASGTVVVAGKDDVLAFGPQTNFYGNLVVIELDTTFEGKPVYTLYGHLSEIYVAEGQHVDAQQFIALSGASGVADGPHLHFEVRLGRNDYGSTYNPRLWLYPFPDYGTVAGRVVRGNGSLVQDTTITLTRVDAASRYLATSSYDGDTVNADAQWDENFVIDDVPMGYYEATVAVGKEKFTEEIYVFPYRTNFVEIVIED